MYDLTVIGGGPAGVTAALHASELGARVALVERDRMGGTCTNDGCVPTRVLAKAARLVWDTRQFDHFGLVGDPPQVRFDRLIARTQQVVYQIQEKKQLIKHLEESGVDVFHGLGAASFIDPHRLQIGGQRELESDKVILCAGGHARRLGFPGAELALTHSDIWSLKSLPDLAVIIGSAATGCQLASILAAFGVYVTLLDIAPLILPAEDETTSVVMQRAFEARGLRIQTQIEGIARIEKDENRYLVFYNKENSVRHLETGLVILSVGWPANLETLNLPAAGIESEHGYVRVNDCLQTTAPNVYAAGDITGRMMLVQSAGYEARIAAENAVRGTEQDFQHQIVPHGGFTVPEYGSVGLTETQARARRLPVDHRAVHGPGPGGDRRRHRRLLQIDRRAGGAHRPGCARGGRGSAGDRPPAGRRHGIWHPGHHAGQPGDRLSDLHRRGWTGGAQDHPPTERKPGPAGLAHPQPLPLPEWERRDPEM